MKNNVIVLDFDGVILESFDIKTDAFRELFSNYPDQVDEVVSYHKKNGGISRYVKFRYIYENILNLPPTDNDLNALADRFSEIVYQRILICPFVNGALDFLKDFHNTMHIYIASGTPEDELRDIINKRGLSEYFSGIFGSPSTKPQIVRNIMHIENMLPSDIIYVGDAISDLNAAREVGVTFIGRNKTENFDNVADYVINDMDDLRKLIRYV
jgi:phosphoglycolate phosphatase-like HAD superfamily hydrolase